MAKTYTDIEQSEKLAEILPIESADMCYPVSYNTSGGVCGIEDVPIVSDYANVNQGEIPCWSLAALLNFLSQSRSYGKISLSFDLCEWYAQVYYPSIEDYDTAYGDEPLDAVYEMIVKLHEQKLI